MNLVQSFTPADVIFGGDEPLAFTEHAKSCENPAQLLGVKLSDAVQTAVAKHQVHAVRNCAGSKKQRTDALARAAPRSRNNSIREEMRWRARRQRRYIRSLLFVGDQNVRDSSAEHQHHS